VTAVPIWFIQRRAAGPFSALWWTFGSYKRRGIFDQMGDYQLPKGGPPAPGSRFALVFFLDLRMRAVMSWTTLICFSSTEFGWRQTSWRDGPRPWGDTRIISGRLGNYWWGNGTIYQLKSDSLRSGRSHNKALHVGMYRNDM